jgi:hypothetical protein
MPPVQPAHITTAFKNKYGLQKLSPPYSISIKYNSPHSLSPPPKAVTIALTHPDDLYPSPPVELAHITTAFKNKYRLQELSPLYSISI